MCRLTKLCRKMINRFFLPVGPASFRVPLAKEVLLGPLDQLVYRVVLVLKVLQVRLERKEPR